MTLEVCLDSLESAMAAQEGGASRIELCANLIEGGTTPSAGMIDVVRRALEIELYVIIRPRGGDFLYTVEEFEVMKKDIIHAANLGADGVVIGLLTSNGAIDAVRSAELIKLARPMGVTFHRAFDMTRNPIKAFDEIIGLGADRVLTSGQKQTAQEGLDLISELVSRSNGHTSVMAGSGIDESNVAEIVRKTRIKEVHVTARKCLQSKMRHQNPDIRMGSVDGMEFTHHVVDAGRVREILRRAVDAALQRND